MEESEFKLNVDRVAIAGVDEGVSPELLAELSRKYPFVEWSVLYKGRFDEEKRERNCFPRIEWIQKLVDETKRFQAETGSPMKLSLHLCGLAVNELIGRHDEWNALKEVWDLLPYFQRIQINAVYSHLEKPLETIPDSLRKLPYSPQFIIQIKGNEENNKVYDILCSEGFDTVPLHDRSGGQGLECEWQLPIGKYCGYAGGLRPENLENNLLAIARVTNGHPIYIDLQSGVREKGLFSIARAEQVLTIAQKWIKQ